VINFDTASSLFFRTERHAMIEPETRANMIIYFLLFLLNCQNNLHRCFYFYLLRISLFTILFVNLDYYQSQPRFLVAQVSKQTCRLSGNTTSWFHFSVQLEEQLFHSINMNEHFNLVCAL
jgi:hypothetical protein